jgi:hypothetical protein
MPPTDQDDSKANDSTERRVREGDGGTSRARQSTDLASPDNSVIASATAQRNTGGDSPTIPSLDYKPPQMRFQLPDTGSSQPAGSDKQPVATTTDQVRTKVSNALGNPNLVTNDGTAIAPAAQALSVEKTPTVGQAQVAGDKQPVTSPGGDQPQLSGPVGDGVVTSGKQPGAQPLDKPNPSAGLAPATPVEQTDERSRPGNRGGQHRRDGDHRGDGDGDRGGDDKGRGNKGDRRGRGEGDGRGRGEGDGDRRWQNGEPTHSDDRSSSHKRDEQHKKDRDQRRDGGDEGQQWRKPPKGETADMDLPKPRTDRDGASFKPNQKDQLEAQKATADTKTQNQTRAENNEASQARQNKRDVDDSSKSDPNNRYDNRNLRERERDREFRIELRLPRELMAMLFDHHGFRNPQRDVREQTNHQREQQVLRDQQAERDRSEQRARERELINRPKDNGEFNAARLQALLRDVENRITRPGDMRVFGQPDILTNNHNLPGRRPEAEQKPLTPNEYKPVTRTNEQQTQNTRNLFEGMRQAFEGQKPTDKNVVRPEDLTTKGLKALDPLNPTGKKLDGKLEDPNQAIKPIKKLEPTEAPTKNDLRSQIEAAIRGLKNQIQPPDTALDGKGPGAKAPLVDDVELPEDGDDERPLMEEEEGDEEGDDDEEKKKKQARQRLLQPEDRRWEEPDKKIKKDDDSSFQPQIVQNELLESDEEELEEEIEEDEEEDVDDDAKRKQFKLNATKNVNGPNQQGQGTQGTAGGAGGGSGMPTAHAPNASPIDPDKVLPGLQIGGMPAGSRGGPSDYNSVIAAMFGDKSKMDRGMVLDQMIARMSERPTHTIEEGDTLESISQKYYNDARVVELIYRLNSARIPTKVITQHRLRIRLVPTVKLYLPTAAEAKRHIKSLHKIQQRRFEYEKHRALVKK